MKTIKLPEAVKGMTSATVRRWLKSVNEPVKAGEDLLELEVEEAFIRLQSDSEGTLQEIVAQEGVTVSTGKPLAKFANGANPVNTDKKETAVSAAEKAIETQPAQAGSVIPILLPQVGNSMEEGTIQSWKVKEGDRIEVGQVIYEAETDKATVEIEATDAGRLAKIVVGEGETVAIKVPVAYLAENDADVDAFIASQGGTVATEAPQPSEAPASAPPAGAVTPILLPQVGNSMEEGTIQSWKVKEGDTIEVGQVLYEVETDKATVEIEATEAGRLARIVAPEGETVAIKVPVAFLAENDADVDAFIASQTTAAAPTPAQQEAPAQQPVATAAPSPAVQMPGGRVKASPAARKLAKERGLDLGTVGAGSGPGGRILSSDLDRARRAAPTVLGEPVRKPIPKMRKAIGKALQKSKQTVPHFYMRVTIDADPLFAFYRKQKPETSCTLNDVIMLACGRTINEFPAFRSRIDGDDIIEYPGANIGVAVGIEDGLVVPVVLNVGHKSLSELAVDAKDTIESARKGKLQNIGQGNFTISNLGMFGVEEFSAIINPPEAAILAVSAVREEVIVKDGTMRPGRVMTMTLSSDHRLIDGLLAAQFCARLKEVLEAPEQMG